MSLEYQERGGGFRVARLADDGSERMLCSLETSSLVTSPGGNRWEPMPYGECTIHSAVGAMTVSDVEEVLAWLRDQRSEAAAKPAPEPAPRSGRPRR